MSVHEHKNAAPQIVGCAVFTISDTRTDSTDNSGKLIKELLKEAGHHVLHYQIVPDTKPEILRGIEAVIDEENVSVILLNGGTGVAARDVTIETVQPLFEKEIVGFGELFRMISYQEDIGSAAMLSRAAAGTYKHKAIFAMPGSTGAVRLAMNRLILPELGHVIREIQKDFNTIL